MKELDPSQVAITSGYWQLRLEMNAKEALSPQWEQLEKSGAIDNFRLLAEGKPGFREGWFFADSDAYKWLEAASRAYALHPSEKLAERIDSFVALIGAAQEEDGNLYTYNQIHFPGVRWTNLQIEHELYCHGHLIEAGVSHYEATGQHLLLEIAEKVANLLVREFLETGPERTPGHQEIEIALMRLYRATGKDPYLALAEHS
ncbi:MAG TPA: beta-L-arabinofuranosidase domain-containing protein, partial [Anaerolineae bacterium]|nr:beta-L-arabinofuranosidase domain-containing protein [Anaerolineae bacterium]